MNKAFKVLWSRLRGSYVVASEASVAHGKSGKAAKTVLAAAAASLIACGSVSAAESVVVDFGYVQGQGTTKFLSGQGNALEIKTNANAAQMLKDLASATSLEQIQSAIAQVDEQNQTAILTGLAGGYNYLDGGAKGALSAFKSFVPDSISKLDNQFECLYSPDDYLGYGSDDREKELNGDTSIKIGSSEEGKISEPVLLATLGGDRVINSGLIYVLTLYEAPGVGREIRTC